MPDRPMKILFACGGTAGHINPALSVANTLRSERPKCKILFVGNPDGMEAKLIPRQGYDFAPIHIQGFQRRLSWANLKRNIKAVRYLAAASGRAREILSEFGPDVVMGTGGYVSGPVLRQAAKMGIPTLNHESNAFPGLATKLLCRYVDKVLLSSERAKDFLPRRDYVVTGQPIRQEILLVDRGKAREKLGVGERICVLSFGGSLGAQRVNQAVAEVVARFHGKGKLHHIHATGQYGTEEFPRALEEKGVNYKGDPHLDIREYIHNMDECLAAADLVICRSGANTLSELEAAGKASILIPSPNVAENHQYHNAMVLAGQNAALVIEEKDLTGERLCEAVGQLVSDPQELKNLGKNAASMAIVDAHRRIVREIDSLLAAKGG